MGEVPDRETTNPNHRRLEKQRKKDSSESRAVSLDEKCRGCSFISVCCINENLEELCGIGLLASFFMALGFSAYEVGLALLDLADSLHGSMASKTLFVREIFVPSIVQKSCFNSMLSQIASLAPGTMMLLVAYAFSQEKILGKSGEARNRKQMKLKLRIR